MSKKAGKWGKGRWKDHKEARKNGWHSRRHETNETQTTSRERYQRKRNKAV